MKDAYDACRISSERYGEAAIHLTEENMKSVFGEKWATLMDKAKDALKPAESKSMPREDAFAPSRRWGSIQSVQSETAKPCDLDDQGPVNHEVSNVQAVGCADSSWKDWKGVLG